MTYYKNWLFLLSIGLTLLASCTTQQTSSEDVLARVGNEYLTISEALNNIPSFLIQEDSLGTLNKYRRDWVYSQVLLQEANRLKLSEKKEVRRKLKKAREEVLKEALKDYIIGSKHEEFSVSDTEARSYYQSNKEQFALTEDYVQFRHLRAGSIQDARQAKQALLRGVPWPEVAQDYAINPKKALHASEQYWPISIAAADVKIMNRYLQIIGQHEISPIQRVDNEYQFVQLIDTRVKGEHPDLDWLMKEIKDWVSMNKKRGHFSSYLNNLYLKAKSNNEIEFFDVINPDQQQTSTPNDTLEIDSSEIDSLNEE